WNTDYRGPILIHASQRFHPQPLHVIRREYDVTLPDPEDMTTGAIIGAADLVDVVTSSRDKFFQGPFGFVLANPHQLRKPYPQKAQLGLRAVKLFDIPTDLSIAIALRQ